MGKGPGTGHLMSDEEKKVNKDLAESLYSMFHPQSVLDIGCKYPYFLSCFKGKETTLLGIDPIEEVLEYGKELNIRVFQDDFESLGEIPAGQFDLVTLIHTFEHFYNPIRSLRAAVQCLSKYGAIFIRIPNIDVKGVERDFTEHHLKIHPHIYSTQTMYIIAEKLGLEIFKVDHFEGAGQSDFYLRVRKERPELSVCMIVRNEAKNVIDCLESIKDIADEIIVVDTGSIDNTKEVVSAYTDLIFDFRWVDDFSAARNFSLSKVTGKFVMWFDADDILQNPEEVKKVLRDKYDVYNFNILYGGDIFKHARLFRNNCNVRFAGRVHEYPIIDGLSFQQKTDINVKHKTEKPFTVNRIER
ncbi:MAG TPA: glycosyltransferase, partial [Desulfatiglandales bacterium]|nr:glycosyltransferase [Desulfatiglandales bacterium]